MADERTLPHDPKKGITEVQSSKYFEIRPRHVSTPDSYGQLDYFNQR